MPAYEYVCKDCKREFTVYLSVREYEEKPKITCPHCTNCDVERKLTIFFAKTGKKS